MSLGYVELAFICGRSKAKVAQRRVIVRPPAEWPVVLAVTLLDGSVVDARDPNSHEAVLVELPVFIAVTAVPLARVVAPLVGETHRNPILAAAPDFLNKAVIEFAVPFACQKRLNGLASLQKLRTIAPADVRGVRKRDSRGIAAVPGILSQAHLVRCGLEREGGQRGGVHGVTREARFWEKPVGGPGQPPTDSCAAVVSSGGAGVDDGEVDIRLSHFVDVVVPGIERYVPHDLDDLRIAVAGRLDRLQIRVAHVTSVLDNFGGESHCGIRLQIV